MKLCCFGDTLYNLDKFIGVEVIDNSDDKSDVISIAFRFEGDYQQLNDENHTPYSFLVNISSYMLEIERINVDDLEDVFENNIHDILKGLASEFVEKFQEKLELMSDDINFTIDLGCIKRGLIKKTKELIESENKK